MTTRTLIFGAAVVAGLGLVAMPALAQGTQEQREACTPDAIRLCADTIPNVGRTTQCMKAHRAELSPRCQAAFDSGAPAAKPRLRVARVKPAPRPVEARMHIAPPPQPRMRIAKVARHRARVLALAHRHGGDRQTREARRVIGRMCGAGLVDAGTCSFMGRVLSLAQ